MATERWTFAVDSVSADRMKAMALLLRDANPIHLDPAAAAARGLGDRVVNQGAGNLGYVLNALLAAGPGATVERLAVRFTGNVLAQDAVTASAAVEGEEPIEGGARRVRCTVALDVEGGARAIEGSATVRLGQNTE